MNHTASLIVRCEKCGAKNRIPKAKATESARCGKCEAILPPVEKTGADAQPLTLRCSECQAKNHVPAAKINARPTCGRCGTLLQTDNIFNPSPVMISDGNFDEMVLKSPLPVLMFSWAPWCTGCQAATPVIHEFAAEARGKVRVGKLNVQSNPLLAFQFNIMSIPFLHIFDGGQIKESLSGGLSKHELMIKMARYL
jgi:thioredoxin 2